MRQPTAEYRNILMDSSRWVDFPFRDGDIVISTPPKSGTTWVQMICALLIFQTPDFPRPLDEMSPWPEWLTHRLEDVLADLEAQPHRRFMKTHLPLDGLPYDERVTYICVGRDPRDAAISWDNHMANTDFDTVMAMRVAAVGADGLDPGAPGALPPPAPTLRDRFWAWADSDEPITSLAWTFHHLSSFWTARDLPNVLLLHYDELKSDLEGQMRTLAARLGIDVAEERWPELVHAASFDYMRDHAREYAPEPVIWHDIDRFFHKGTSGQWRELLDERDLLRYDARVRELAAPDLAAWVHRGPIVG